MTTVARETIGGGDYGAQQTLQKMRQLVNASLMVPRVVEHATAAVAVVPSRDYRAMANEIRAWLSRNFKFVPDPVGVELLRDPEYQLTTFDNTGRILGDCDDAAILGAALAKAVGIRASFVAVGFTPGGPLRHVFAILTGPAAGGIRWGTPISLDVTRPPGANAPIQRQMVVTV